ncbi:MAG: T9SS type A sorting domain-containing protein [Bacteroidetes bacterium]|nr:T9SS type A sorting domain-containing protein [Bacteroidota bacterium]
MKIKSYSYPLVMTSLIGCFLLVSAFDDTRTHRTENASGQAGGTTAPGDTHTCSQAGCHGAGNGNGSTGGLVDNAGPGNITITSNPAMVGNTYVPGTVYQMSITVNETGKTIFGFVAQMLDNSGNTDLHVNNTAGTVTVTDAVHTHTMASFGTGRMDITHTTNGGLSTNSATFKYSWKAPTTGTVNVYTSATACNHDGFASAADNTYNKHIVLVPSTATGVEELLNANSVVLFPNPSSEQVALSFHVNTDEEYSVALYSLAGKLVKDFGKNTTSGGDFNQSYNIQDMASGIYLVKIASERATVYKKLTIN